MAGEAERALASLTAAVDRGEERIAALSPDLAPEERSAAVVAIRDEVLRSVGPYHRALDATARRASGAERRAAMNAAQAGTRRLTAFLRGSTTPLERIAAARDAARR